MVELSPKLLMFLFSIIIINIVNCQNLTDTVICSSQVNNINSINRTISNSEIDSIDRIRVFLFNELLLERKNPQFISEMQNLLNTGKVKYRLSKEENLILYIYVQKWDKVLNTLLKMDYPYEINHLSIVGEDVFIMQQKNILNPTIIMVKKENFVNEQVYCDILNSDLLEEQKTFLTIFIPKYFGYNYTLSHVKVRTAYKDFKKKYPKSQYLKYIRPSSFSILHLEVGKK